MMECEVFEICLIRAVLFRLSGELQCKLIYKVDILVGLPSIVFEEYGSGAEKFVEVENSESRCRILKSDVLAVENKIATTTSSGGCDGSMK